MYGETWYASLLEANETHSTMVYIEMWKDTIDLIVNMIAFVKSWNTEIIEVNAYQVRDFINNRRINIKDSAVDSTSIYDNLTTKQNKETGNKWIANVERIRNLHFSIVGWQWDIARRMVVSFGINKRVYVVRNIGVRYLLVVLSWV